MAKKHRVKRQRYVDHLRQLEKERDAYLDKRRNGKRGRQERLDEEVMGAARDKAECPPSKKRRMTEDAVARKSEDEEESYRPNAAAVPKARAAKNVSPSSEKTSSGFFAELPSTSASPNSVVSTGVEATAAKKKAVKRKY